MMPVIDLDGHQLVAVPALCGDAAFAEAAHRACRACAPRPQAIALAMGADQASALTGWLRELTTARPPGTPLPCMLGLLWNNRLVHPRHLDAALRLQEIHGRPLPRLPQALVQEAAGFTPATLLCLSATDAMIEAARSAVELDLPVYGVDLAEYAQERRPTVILPDSTRLAGDLAAFVARTAPLAAANRDSYVDGRREQVMASRLKVLGRLYQTVLFVGPLAHWQRLKDLLLDPRQPAARELPPGDPTRLRRVVVDPLLAIRQMDDYPVLTSLFEQARRMPFNARARQLLGKETLARIRGLLVEVALPEEREAALTLDQYAAGLALLSQRAYPDLCGLLKAANAMISPAYTKRLADKLITAAIAWASPADFPGVPGLTLGPAENGFTTAEPATPWVRLTLPGAASFLCDDPAGTPPRHPPLHLPGVFQERLVREPERGRTQCFTWVWPPCENRFFGLAYAAAQRARDQNQDRRTEPFSGSLLDGLDPKATVRAFARKDGRVQVRAPRHRENSLREALTEPVVFLFERPPEQVNPPLQWNLLLASGTAAKFVRDLARFEEVAACEGTSFVSSVNLSLDSAVPKHWHPWVHSMHYLWGAVAFGNPCVNARQAAAWLEENDYRCCPILRHKLLGDLFDYYRRKHDLTLRREDWPSTLILLALPYARSRVVVLAHEGFHLSEPVRRAAASRRVQVCLLPLAQFPEDRVREARRQYLVYPLDSDGDAYPPELELLLAECPDAHQGQLPEWIRAQACRAQSNRPPP